MVTCGRASSWATEVLISEIASRSGIFGEAAQILNNQERENSPFSLLIGLHSRPFLDYTVLI